MSHKSWPKEKSSESPETKKINGSHKPKVQNQYPELHSPVTSKYDNMSKNISEVGFHQKPQRYSFGDNNLESDNESIYDPNESSEDSYELCYVDVLQNKSMHQLSPNKLMAKSNLLPTHPYSYTMMSKKYPSSSSEFQNSASSSQSFDRKHCLLSYSQPFTQLKDHTDDGLGKKNRSLIFFCKALFFAFLLLCFVLVIVTVSVFLSRSGQRSAKL